MTLVDTDIIIDLLSNDPNWRAWSQARLVERSVQGPLAINDIVYAELAARFATLTMRERQVVEGLVAGRSNKAIAKWLACSPRTIEAHRAHIMEKMESGSLPDLVRLYLEMGLPQ